MKNKVYILLVVLVSFVSGQVFANISRSFYESDELRNWNFQFDLGESIGFNMDLSSYGMESEFEMDMKSIIAPKEDQVYAFNNIRRNGYVAGVIEVKDFEIIFGLDDNTLVNDDQTNFLVPKISWGEITGTLYIGPISVLLTASDHDDGIEVSSLDNVDVGFTNISYSVVPIKTTASYSEQEVRDNTDVYVYDFSTVSEDGAVESSQITERDYGAIELGYAFEDVFKVKLGLSTEYSFTQLDSGDSMIPLSASALFELTAFENFRLKVFNGVLIGNEGRMFLEKNNPYVFGASAGYRMNIGPLLDFIPQFGGEANISFPTSIDPDVSVNGEEVDDAHNTRIFKMPIAITGSLLLDWSKVGINNKTDDYLQFNTSKRDTVIDGIGLTGTFGYTQHEIFQTLDVPYMGAKFTIWEYENDPFGNYEEEQEKRNGLVKNLGLVFIGNINYSFGGVVTGVHKYFQTYGDILPNSYIRIDRRLDYGLVLDMSYVYTFLKHRVGIIYKQFDALEGEDTFFFNGLQVMKSGRAFENKEDLRVKIGFDAITLVRNMKISVDWVSGDLLKTTSDSIATYSDYDYFYNTNASGLSSVKSHAHLGYISIGLLYRFK